MWDKGGETTEDRSWLCAGASCVTVEVDVILFSNVWVKAFQCVKSTCFNIDKFMSIFLNTSFD